MWKRSAHAGVFGLCAAGGPCDSGGVAVRDKSVAGVGPDGGSSNRSCASSCGGVARETSGPRAAPVVGDGFVEVCEVDRIAEKCAKIVSLSGERVAVFRYDGKVSAISNVCQHQNGPLGEGRIIDGCITCPWHGYQYQPESGAAPPPFKEKVPDLSCEGCRRNCLRCIRGRILPGTHVESAEMGLSELRPGRHDRDERLLCRLSPKAPATLARFVRRVIVGLGLLAATIGMALVIGQAPFSNSAFEYGKDRKLEGVVETRPYPALLVARPGTVLQEKKYSRYLLVAPGKHGADGLVAGFDGRRVTLQGQLIYREGGVIVELQPNSIHPLDSQSANDAAAHDLGPVTVTGEIVDSKCYLGVMNPGQGKVHRDCAARCLSGGIPPIFVTTDGGGQLLLVDPDGNAIGRDALREFVAEPITIHGELLQKGDSRLLRIDARKLRHSPDGLEAALPSAKSRK